MSNKEKLLPLRNKPIKVLHFLSSIAISSGVASVIMNYYRNIDKDRVQFDFLYFNNDIITYEKEIKDLGGKIYKIERPNISKRSFNEIRKIFKEISGEYRILHNHEVYLNFLLAPLAKKNGFKSVITHSHTTAYSDKFVNSIRNKILCMPLKRQSDCFMACSQAAGISLYGNKCIKNNKVSILNNAINCEKFKYNEEKRDLIRKQLGIENKFVLGHVGRFNFQKNHKFLLEIFNEILKLNENSILILVGDGPLFEEIKKLSEKMKINNNIIFLGRRNDVQDLLQAMDVFLLPSLYEGLPVIGVEAQASGLPCIMSDTITKEVNIDNVKYVSLKKDAEIWAKEVLHIYNNSQRKNVVQKIKSKGFDIEIESKKLEKFYMNLNNIN